jgi:hypothetical protein
MSWNANDHDSPHITGPEATGPVAGEELVLAQLVVLLLDRPHNIRGRHAGPGSPPRSLRRRAARRCGVRGSRSLRRPGCGLLKVTPQDADRASLLGSAGG